MSSVRRVYVEKKPEFAVQAKALRHEIRHYLGIWGVTGVRVLIRYDIENLSGETFEKACRTVFAEPPVDMRRISPDRAATMYFLWNICQDSLTRERIRRSSVCASSKRTKNR